MAKGFMSEDVGSTARQITIQIEKQFDPALEGSMIREALVNAAKQFAEKWLEENKDKIYERLNVDALANMILIEAAKQTKDDVLGKK